MGEAGSGGAELLKEEVGAATLLFSGGAELLFPMPVEVPDKIGGAIDAVKGSAGGKMYFTMIYRKIPGEMTGERHGRG